VGDVAQHLDELDLQAVLVLPWALADDDAALAFLDHRRRRHPVQGLDLVAVAVGPDHHGPVGLDHQEPSRLGQIRLEASAVGDLATSNDQTHAAGGYSAVRTWPKATQSATAS
jgi:hypothetical protein